MFARFRKSRESEAIATAVYGAIVAQARTPALYARLGVADTVDGRFEMVVLHTTLAIRRLRDGGDGEIAQLVFDTFCADMDQSLRQLGVGDLKVGKKMRKMAEAFYGRAGVYDAALNAGDMLAMGDAIARNVFASADARHASALAAYAMAASTALAAAPREAVIGGRLPFPDPEASVGERTS